jgi:hypothetical protein
MTSLIHKDGNWRVMFVISWIDGGKMQVDMVLVSGRDKIASHYQITQSFFIINKNPIEAEQFD